MKHLLGWNWTWERRRARCMVVDWGSFQPVSPSFNIYPSIHGLKPFLHGLQITQSKRNSPPWQSMSSFIRTNNLRTSSLNIIISDCEIKKRVCSWVGWLLLCERTMVVVVISIGRDGVRVNGYFYASRIFFNSPNFGLSRIFLSTHWVTGPGRTIFIKGLAQPLKTQ